MAGQFHADTADRASILSTLLTLTVMPPKHQDANAAALRRRRYIRASDLDRLYKLAILFTILDSCVLLGKSLVGFDDYHRQVDRGEQIQIKDLVRFLE